MLIRIGKFHLETVSKSVEHTPKTKVKYRARKQNISNKVVFNFELPWATEIVFITWAQKLTFQ